MTEYGFKNKPSALIPTFTVMAALMTLSAEWGGAIFHRDGNRNKKPANHGPSKQVKNKRKSSKQSRRKNRKK